MDDAVDFIDMSSSFLTSRERWWFFTGGLAPACATRTSRELLHFLDCINIDLAVGLDNDDDFSSSSERLLLLLLVDVFLGEGDRWRGFFSSEDDFPSNNKEEEETFFLRGDFERSRWRIPSSDVDSVIFSPRQRLTGGETAREEEEEAFTAAAAER